MRKSYHTFVTVISLVAKVPVLSDRMRDVDPNMFRHNQYVLPRHIGWPYCMVPTTVENGANDSREVAVAGKPWGLILTMTTKKALMKEG